MIVRSLLIAAATAFLVATGCRKPPISSYQIPKEKDPEFPAAAPATAGNPAMTPGAAAGNAMASTPVTTAEGPGLAWTAPADWRPKPASAMRKGSYTVPGTDGHDGDLSITAFPGDVGGELANVNRWRGQVQLAPISDAELPGAVQHIGANGLAFTIVDVAGNGPNAQRILGALVPYQGATWFIKLLGPDPLVGQAKPQFLAFLQTVKPAAEGNK